MVDEFRRIERGYILTSQEHLLGASSGAGIDCQVNRRDPYKPLGLLYGKYTLEEVRRAREDRKAIGAFIWNFEIPGLPETATGVTVTLEPLDENGNTIRDPQPLDENGVPIKDYRKTDYFPCKRE